MCAPAYARRGAPVGAHAAGRVQCATCHKDVGSSKSLASNIGVSMKDCRKCHSEVQNVSGLKNDCAFCHKTISREWKPLDHQANWKSLHGKAVGFMTKDAAQRCETCHTQAWCLSCHRQEKPASHTNFWRDRGHNVMAELDRQSCRTCHTGDFCVRCHRASAPNVLFRRISAHRNATSIGRCEDCHFEGAGRLAPHRNPGTTHCLQCHRIVGG